MYAYSFVSQLFLGVQNLPHAQVGTESAPKSENAFDLIDVSIVR